MHQFQITQLADHLSQISMNTHTLVPITSYPVDPAQPSVCTVTLGLRHTLQECTDMLLACLFFKLYTVCVFALLAASPKVARGGPAGGTLCRVVARHAIGPNTTPWATRIALPWH